MAQEHHEPVVDLLVTEWSSIVALCSTLDDDQWATPTDCPGWSVKDNVSHLIGIENLLLGAPADPRVPAPGPHVRDEIGAFNEAAVAARRDRSGADVLDEFRAVTAERLAALQSLPAAKWDEIGPTPTGPDTYRHFMTMRVFDSWSHEQDIRRAVGRTGHLAGPVVDAVFAWHWRNLGYVVGKRAGVRDGAVVAFAVHGPTTERVALGVTRGRASLLTDGTHSEGTGTDGADATLVLDTEAYHALLCGRWSAAQTADRGRLRIEGDTDLGWQVAGAMAYVS